MNQTEIADYLDNRGPLSERERVETHLAECVECRNEVVEVRELLHQVRKPGRLIKSGTILAVAAALAVVVWPTINPRRPSVVAPAPRRAAVGTVLVAYGPLGESSRQGMRFVWKPAPGATTYRLTVFGENGVPLWSRSGIDTAVILPDSITLRSQGRYLWIADALLGNGGTRSTGMREFRLVQ